MEIALEIFLDALIDTLKLLPFLFVTYLAMEALEHRAGDRARKAIAKAGAAGPAVGAVLGLFPQCGFSAAAATFYAGRVITLGTLFAVFLATSDEMLPIFIAEQVDAGLILKILGLKLGIGLVTGFILDAALRIICKHKASVAGVGAGAGIHELCVHEGCDCHDSKGGVLRSALKHTLQVTLFIFLVSFVLGALIALAGEEALAHFLMVNPGLSVFASALVGLVPNCAASVAITQLYLEGVLGAGAMMAGLLVSAGIGLLVLFRTNRPLRENLAFVAGLFVAGVFWGLAVNVFGFGF